MAQFDVVDGDGFEKQIMSSSNKSLWMTTFLLETPDIDKLMPE
jgi:hypothetical protein